MLSRLSIGVLFAALALGLNRGALYADEAIPVELLVKCEGGPSGALAQAADAAVGATTIRRFEVIGWHCAGLPAGVSLAEGMARYRAQPGVLHVEPNRTVLRLPPVPPPPPEAGTSEDPVVRPHSEDPAPIVPNDPRYRSQWNLKKIGMEQAWATTTGSSNVVVAVIDTGVNYLHPDLAANMWRNPGETGLDAQNRDKATNGIDDDGNGYIDDVHGIDVQNHTGDPMDFGNTDPSSPDPNPHGTKTAGVIGAVGNNNIGFAGINWQVNIMAIKYSGGDQSLFYTSDKSEFAEAMEYLVQMKRRGVNLRVVSLGWSDDVVGEIVTDSVRAVGAEGILCAFPAGNSGFDLDSTQWLINTADLFNIVTVGGSGRSDELLFSYGRSTVDLIAPGTETITTGFGESYITTFRGTSASTPHVAGAAALLCAAKPGISIAELRTALLGSVDPVPAAKGKTVTGGRLNVARALQSLTDSSRAPMVIWSSPTGLRAGTNVPVHVVFSQPMNRTSVEQAFVIDPPVAGNFEWSPDGTQFTFRHQEPFLRTNHTARITALAKDIEGRTLDGNFDHQEQDSPADDYLWSFRFPLLNDDFAGALRIAGAAGNITANNRTATVETSEQPPKGYYFFDYDASVWYQWTAPSDGWFTFDLTTGTTFDSILTVFSGTAIETLDEVASSVDYGSRTSSRASFSAAIDRTYAIAVAGVWADNLVGTMGNFTLRWYPTPPPGITSFTPATGAPGQVVTLVGTNFTGATQVTLNGQPATFAFSTNADFLDLRLSVTVPAGATSGLFRVETPHGDTTAATEFTVIPIPALVVKAVTESTVILSWPDDAIGFALEAKDTLESNPGWQPVSLQEIQPPTPGRVTVADSLSRGARLYRLRRP
ncbi:MAG TPA: hypothetical protein DCE44_01005 [Verrucomicrobiales bacterium]|nr:hypothetical protein [Verrucomicrobiales bacterium]